MPGSPSLGAQGRNHLKAVKPCARKCRVRSMTLLGSSEIAEHGGVGADAIARGSAEELIDGRVEQLAFEVPEGEIDLAERHHCCAFAAVDGVAVHLVPDALDGVGVFADEQVDEGALDDGDVFVGDLSTDAGGAVIGVDEQEAGLYCVGGSAGGVEGPTGQARLEVGVDIFRAGEEGFAEGLVVVPLGGDVD